MNWQSIETAPKDGKPVYVHRSGCIERKPPFEPPTGRYVDGEWVCSAAFMHPVGPMLIFEPDLWAPIE